MESTPKTPIKAREALDSGKEVILRSEGGRDFWGQLSSTPATDDLILLKDARGRVHFFDRDHLERAKVYLPGKELERKGIHPLRPPQESFDPGPLRKKICDRYHEFRQLPEFKKITKALGSLPQNFWRSQLFRRYAYHCAGAVGLVMTVHQQIYPLIHKHRQSLPYGNHLSNAAFGLPFMMLMDQCLKSIAPSAHRQILLATLGVNALTNVYLELDIPGLWQPEFVTVITGGERPTPELEIPEDWRDDLVDTLEGATRWSEVRDTRTDWADFNSGILATISYASFSLWLEKTTWLSKARLCY